MIQCNRQFDKNFENYAYDKKKKTNPIALGTFSAKSQNTISAEISPWAGAQWAAVLTVKLDAYFRFLLPFSGADDGWSAAALGSARSGGA